MFVSVLLAVLRRFPQHGDSYYSSNECIYVYVSVTERRLPCNLKSGIFQGIQINDYLKALKVSSSILVRINGQTLKMEND
jgi:hypothetical protein